MQRQRRFTLRLAQPKRAVQARRHRNPSPDFRRFCTLSSFFLPRRALLHPLSLPHYSTRCSHKRRTSQRAVGSRPLRQSCKSRCRDHSPEQSRPSQNRSTVNLRQFKHPEECCSRQLRPSFSPQPPSLRLHPGHSSRLRPQTPQSLVRTGTATQTSLLGRLRLQLLALCTSVRPYNNLTNPYFSLFFSPKPPFSPPIKSYPRDLTRKCSFFVLTQVPPSTRLSVG